MSSMLETIQADLARNIIARRKALNMSQEKLALQAGVDRTYVSQLERGIANPSISILCRIAEILQCKMQDLVSDELSIA
ncbi:helix-turn-helix domain-containing protein [Methylophilus sp. 14]|uniref:helix-turn-helix domain-containing protein n=1 Tax=Methylophilus sp. 14 TaxID=2781019 RepID=UPI00188EABAE|nr:helix-turn-helix transcriptional regulator [Methylophilus sp. 14]MBF4988187.1 helix-turn-helix transcriptional regulator [Methylophilus sp. 14]